jgi:dienelactone hydrolase
MRTDTGPLRPLRGGVVRRVVAAALAGAVAATALALPATAATPHRGQLVSATHLTGLSATDTATTLTDAGFDASQVEYGVDAYKLVYRTVDTHGKPTTASGLLVLPRRHDRRLWTVSFGHGTEIYHGDAPSAFQDDGFLRSPAETYAASGFAAVAPDYLGFGASTGPHPWMDVPSETTASLDLLRAARSYAPHAGHALDRQVLATGFSQGASAALGLARALRSGADPWFRLAAVAPISGAYDVRGAEIPAMFDRSQGVPEPIAVVYATYLLVSYNRLHHLYDSPYQVFQKDYAPHVDKLFDGSTTGQDMARSLPPTLDELLTDQGKALLQHPTGPLAAALRVTDSVCDWTPGVPVRLYDATGDEQAVTANTAHCQASLAARGVTAPVVDLGTPAYDGSRHLGSAVAGTAAADRWFSRLHH